MYKHDKYSTVVDIGNTQRRGRGALAERLIASPLGDHVNGGLIVLRLKQVYLRSRRLATRCALHLGQFA